MEDLFARLVLGHFVGDYLFQNVLMMLNKSKTFDKSKKGLDGIIWCTIHSLVYTAIVCLFLWTINPWIVIAVFVSHWPIDRWSLAGKWMRLIGSRNLGEVYFSKEIDAAFWVVVYVVTDNTMHILLVWLATKWLM